MHQKYVYDVYLHEFDYLHHIFAVNVSTSGVCSYKYIFMCAFAATSICAMSDVQFMLPSIALLFLYNTQEAPPHTRNTFNMDDDSHRLTTEMLAATVSIF